MSYVIQPGDNLGKIAKLYRTSVIAIKSDNGLNSDNIYPGEVILINGSGKEKSNNAHATRAIARPNNALHRCAAPRPKTTAPPHCHSSASYSFEHSVIGFGAVQGRNREDPCIDKPFIWPSPLDARRNRRGQIKRWRNRTDVTRQN
uniref:LysM peptidoglycan-binding domain-containing protein n=1 Tax=Variovorax boronicumulans TaxID=436515 RepID=UPI0027D7C5E3|nr:LysM peptidoglycan-binding domain-containing protein [Variovorax boronicumulans]